MNKMLKLNIIVFVTLLFGALTIILLPSKAYAACESNGAYGQTCVYNKRFRIEKKVRIEGESTWRDKVINVKEGQIVEFKIEVKNTGEIDVDKMKMTDILPSELERISGSGLTEEWNDFEVGEKETFVIKARVKSREYDRSENFEKCVVNKAELRYKGDLEGSDTATVCYGNKEITELPETGATSTELMTMFGLASTGFGMLLKRRK